jgi:cell division protein ZapE
MTPEHAYRTALQGGSFSPDAAQAGAVARLDRLHRTLAATQARARPEGTGLGKRLLRLARKPRPQPPVRGLYLWGGVGRGKTWLMDLFYDNLPFDAKQRVHYHRFMQGVHAELDSLKGRPNPLLGVADGIAAQARVLCLDEMQVNDITDAMIMAGLLDALFSRGVTLVTTSNVPPDGLYRAGLQRDRFEPAIGLLQQHCEVLELASPTDYRLRRLEQAPVYLTPLNSSTDTALARYFSDITAPEHRRETAVIINDRDVPVVAHGDGAVWFDFDVICHIPRSKLDYVEVARCFHTVLLSNIRRLDDEQSNIAHRLITLIDAVYDRNVKLMVSAEAPPDRLYSGRDLAFEFQRTASRLAEMQTAAFLGRPHLC